jgi:RNA polymerase sigma factor (sigma-70 family)
VTRLLVVDELVLADAVALAKAGDREALERVVAGLQDDVFRLALRMAACTEDAEDASQEILIKVITRLDGFRGESSVRTWAYRIAVRHMLDRKKSRVEALALDFARFGADLLEGVSAEPDPDPVLVGEVKLGCTLAMLTCLDREHRVAYVLCDVFDLAQIDAAAICDISEDTLRQRLSRARRALEAFTTAYCGLVAQGAPCACSKRVARAVELGRVHRDQRTADPAVRAATAEMEGLYTSAGLMRSHPQYQAPERLRAAIRTILDGPLQVFAAAPRS